MNAHTDTYTVDAVADVLGLTVSRHASARDDRGWLDVPAGIHPGDARNAARDLLDQLGARGLTIAREPVQADKSLAGRLTWLARRIEQTTDPVMLDLLAALLSGMAEEAAEEARQASVVPLRRIAS